MTKKGLSNIDFPQLKQVLRFAPKPQTALTSHVLVEVRICSYHIFREWLTAATFGSMQLGAVIKCLAAYQKNIEKCTGQILMMTIHPEATLVQSKVIAKYPQHLCNNRKLQDCLLPRPGIGWQHSQTPPGTQSAFSRPQRGISPCLLSKASRNNGIHHPCDSKGCI